MNTILQLISSPLRAPLVMPVLMMLLLWLCWWRAGSAYVLLDWLWRRFRIRAAPQNHQFERFVQENAALVRLRFVYGIEADSFEAMQRLLAWANDHAVSAGDVKRCRKWIVIHERVSLRSPSKLYVVLFCGLAMVSSSLLYASIGLGMSSLRYALLETKESHIWFQTDGVIMKRIGGGAISGPECESDIPDFAKKMGFTPREATVTCAALGGKEFRRFATYARHEQALASLLAGALVLYVAWRSLAECAGALTAIKLRSRLKGVEGRASALHLAEPGA